MAKFILDIEDSIKTGFTDFKKANTLAIKNTLDTQAGLTRRNAIKKIQDNFTLRNTFTKRNIRFEKTEGNVISKMESRVGATQPASYMRLQELGGQRPDADGRTAIGQAMSRTGQNRRKPVSRSLYIQKISKKIVRGPFKRNLKTSRSRSVASMFVAQKKKLFIKRNNNIYRVSSIFASGGKVKSQIEHFYNIQTKAIHINPDPWLEPATLKPARDGFNIYKSQIKKLWKNADVN